MPPGAEFDRVTDRSEEELARRTVDANVLFVATRQIDAATLRLAPRVRFIQKAGIGYDNIDVGALNAVGVLAAYTPRAPTIPTAEHTIALMLALSKRIAVADRATRTGRWNQGELMQAGLGDIQGSTIGLIGLGSIGTAVAERLLAFGPRLLYTKRQRAAPDLEAKLSMQYVSLEELLASSDIVSVHVPLTESTRGLIGEAGLARMRPGALLINTSRGEVVDEPALRRAIESGRLGGAALDVLVNERNGGNPFADLPQVIVTPHVGGPSRAGTRRMVEESVANIKRYLAGEMPSNLIPGITPRVGVAKDASGTGGK
jgi:phosphoglycerate dehydrogenase-like enzyme